MTQYTYTQFITRLMLSKLNEDLSIGSDFYGNK